MSHVIAVSPSGEMSSHLDEQTGVVVVVVVVVVMMLSGRETESAIQNSSTPIIRRLGSQVERQPVVEPKDAMVTQVVAAVR